MLHAPPTMPGEFGSGLHRVNRGAGTPPGAQLQADGDPEESLAGAGESSPASLSHPPPAPLSSIPAPLSQLTAPLSSPASATPLPDPAETLPGAAAPLPRHAPPLAAAGRQRWTGLLLLPAPHPAPEGQLPGPPQLLRGFRPLSIPVPAPLLPGPCLHPP